MTGTFNAADSVGTGVKVYILGARLTSVTMEPDGCLTRNSVIKEQPRETRGKQCFFIPQNT